VKPHYYPETDSLYIGLADRPSADTREVSNGVLLGFDENGDLVGIDIDAAPGRIDLSTLEAGLLPLRARRSA